MRRFRRATVHLLSTALLVAPTLASAVTPYTVENFGGQVGLGTADLKTVFVNVIAWLLGIASLFAVVMIIVGGFMWLTSSGNDEKLDHAKKTISGAVVGLVLVVISWAIVVFVAGTTRNVAV